MNRDHKEPSYTSQVVALLRAHDDFLTSTQLAEALRPRFPAINSTAIGTILRFLKSRGVVDAVSVEGRLWWMYLGDDQRARTVDEKKPPNGPKRARRLPSQRSILLQQATDAAGKEEENG